LRFVQTGLVVGIAACLLGCSSGITLGEAKITTPSHCPEIEVLESGDVRLCHHAYAHWTGTLLEKDGQPLFVVNRGQITAGGHVVARYDGEIIEVIVDDGVPTKHLRIQESGKVVDESGATVAKITPAPDDEGAALVFAALLREGIWLPALPPKKQRVSATEVQVIGRERESTAPPPLCTCGAGPE
jgi:hypothetical protein